jgi:hypothetical protein
MVENVLACNLYSKTSQLAIKQRNEAYVPKAMVRANSKPYLTGYQVHNRLEHTAELMFRIKG